MDPSRSRPLVERNPRSDVGGVAELEASTAPLELLGWKHTMSYYRGRLLNNTGDFPTQYNFVSHVYANLWRLETRGMMLHITF